jgi:hypothetical protein
VSWTKSGRDALVARIAARASRLVRIGVAPLATRKLLDTDRCKTLIGRDQAKGALILVMPPYLVRPSCHALFCKTALQKSAEASLESLAPRPDALGHRKERAVCTRGRGRENDGVCI